MMDDGFIPSFNVQGKFENIMHIHEDKKSAKKVVDSLGEGFYVVECVLNYKLKFKSI